MKTHKVTSVLYTDKKGKRKRGLWILDRQANTVVMLDKRLKKVNINECTNIITQEFTEGNIYFDLNRR